MQAEQLPSLYIVSPLLDRLVNSVYGLVLVLEFKVPVSARVYLVGFRCLTNYTLATQNHEGIITYAHKVQTDNDFEL